MKQTRYEIDSELLKQIDGNGGKKVITLPRVAIQTTY